MKQKYLTYFAFAFLLFYAVFDVRKILPPEQIPVVDFGRVCFAQLVPEVMGTEAVRVGHLAFMGPLGNTEVEFLPTKARAADVSERILEIAEANYCGVVILKSGEI